MDEVLSLLEFMVDLICMVPPIRQLELPTLPVIVVPAVFCASIVLVIAGMMPRATEETSGFGGWGLPVVAALVMVIGIMGLGASTIESLFVIAYPPMVICMRCGEGALVGATVPEKARVWHIAALLALSVVLYFALRHLRREALIWFLLVWSAAGVLLASAKWTKSVANAKGSPFNAPLAFIGLFGVFAATLLYVSTTQFERMLFMSAFPVGLALGVIGQKKRWPGRRDAGA